MSIATAAALLGILADITEERNAQDKKWGEQNHPDGTGHFNDGQIAELAIASADAAAEAGTLTWKHILREEYAEAMAERDPVRLREELVQVAAVAAAWIEAIDRRDK